jgi:hypothetical protein
LAINLKSKNLLIGFILLLAISVAGIFLKGKLEFFNGILWGFTLSYSGLLLFIFLPNFKQNNSYKKVSIATYLSRSAIRITIIMALFLSLIFLLKVHAIGLLVGSFVSMMILNFYFLFNMKQSQ